VPPRGANAGSWPRIVPESRRFPAVAIGSAEDAADRVRIEPAANEEHPDTLARGAIGRQRPSAQVSLQSNPRPIELRGRQLLVLSGPTAACVDPPERLYDVTRHPTLPELRLDQSVPARGVPVPLIEPPGGEGGIVGIPECLEPAERRGDDVVGRVCGPQPALELPARPWPGREVPQRDLERCLRAGGLDRLAVPPTPPR
jgi:hypothetical protein